LGTEGKSRASPIEEIGGKNLMIVYTNVKFSDFSFPALYGIWKGSQKGWI
jgi:hypothetical protein